MLKPFGSSHMPAQPLALAPLALRWIGFLVDWGALSSGTAVWPMGSVSAVLGLTKNEWDFVYETVRVSAAESAPTQTLLTLLAATGAATVRLFPADFPEQPCRLQTENVNELASVDLFGRLPLRTPHSSAVECALASGWTYCTYETVQPQAQQLLDSSLMTSHSSTVECRLRMVMSQPLLTCVDASVDLSSPDDSHTVSLHRLYSTCYTLLNLALLTTGVSWDVRSHRLLLRHV